MTQLLGSKRPKGQWSIAQEARTDCLYSPNLRHHRKAFQVLLAPVNILQISSDGRHLSRQLRSCFVYLLMRLLSYLYFINKN